jgi:hypothetical protein
MRCTPGYYLRKAFTRKGSYIKSACIRKISPYNQSSNNFKKVTLKRISTRLRGFKKSLRRNNIICPTGSILRKSYVRIIRKTGKKVRVPASCIPDMGLPGKRTEPGIGPLRKGELGRFGYKSSLNRILRYQALKKAVKELGSLSVWKKLNVLYIYNKNTNPLLSEKYNSDKNWIKNVYGLKAF